MKSQPEATSAVSELPGTLPPVIVIFGAAVWKGGLASHAMRRRVEGALRSAADRADAIFLVTGGVGKHPPSEAAVMASLLRQQGVREADILLDEQSGDTLQSVRNCVRLLAAMPLHGPVIVCSDVYHIPRCRWLLRLNGVSTVAGDVASGRSQTSPLRWCYYYVRELAAIPWDTLLTLLSGFRESASHPGSPNK